MVRSILLPANERKAVARERSSHLCSVTSRSFNGPLIETSAGPHKTYSRTDFVLEINQKHKQKFPEEYKDFLL